MSNILNNGEITTDSDCMLQAFSVLMVKAKFKPRVDNFVFRLHYRFTFIVFMVGAMLSTLYDVVGEKIVCMMDSQLDDDDELLEAVQSYCYITGTYTVDKLHYGEVGVDMPHPGVGPHSPTDAVTHHTYYQWVPFVLILQGAMFYLPHLIWKNVEGGIFRTIIQDLSVRDYLSSDKSGESIDNYFNRETQYRNLAEYITGSLRTRKRWAVKFLLCEFLNLAMTVKTVFVINYFLGGEFFSYGLKVISMTNMDPENRTDPMSQVFPTMGKCSFKMYGPSGTIEKRDIMCLLPTNIINEKVYVFIWFWLFILAVITTVWLITRTACFVRPLREKLLTLRAFSIPRLNKKDNQPLLMTLAAAEDVKLVLKEMDFGDYVLLSQLADSMDTAMFSEFVKFLANFMRKNSRENVRSICDRKEKEGDDISSGDEGQAAVLNESSDS